MVAVFIKATEDKTETELWEAVTETAELGGRETGAKSEVSGTSISIKSAHLLEVGMLGDPRRIGPEEGGAE